MCLSVFVCLFKHSGTWSPVSIDKYCTARILLEQISLGHREERWVYPRYRQTWETRDGGKDKYRLHGKNAVTACMSDGHHGERRVNSLVSA